MIQIVLARTFPEARLLPSGDQRTVTEAQVMMAWFASGLQPAVGRQRFPGVFCGGDAACVEAIRRAARAELAKGFAILERRLHDRDWLFGDWSIVDAFMLWLWFRAVGSGMDPDPFPRCADHCRRTEQRPSVAAVLDREEAEFERFAAQGTVPSSIPPHQVGRTPSGSSDPMTVS